jgi:hypothetical protein
VRHTSSGLRPPSPRRGEGIPPFEAERESGCDQHGFVPPRQGFGDHGERLPQGVARWLALPRARIGRAVGPSVRPSDARRSGVGVDWCPFVVAGTPGRRPALRHQGQSAQISGSKSDSHSSSLRIRVYPCPSVVEPSGAGRAMPGVPEFVFVAERVNGLRPLCLFAAMNPR